MNPSRKELRKAYEKELRSLQEELVKLQLWVKRTGARIIIVFEGRDAAGKGGVIKRITERTSPRVFRVVALPCTIRAGEVSDLHSALRSALSGGRSSFSTAVGITASAWSA